MHMSQRMITYVSERPTLADFPSLCSDSQLEGQKTFSWEFNTHRQKREFSELHARCTWLTCLRTRGFLGSLLIVKMVSSDGIFDKVKVAFYKNSGCGRGDDALVSGRCPGPATSSFTSRLCVDPRSIQRTLFSVCPRVKFGKHHKICVSKPNYVVLWMIYGHAHTRTHTHASK